MQKHSHWTITAGFVAPSTGGAYERHQKTADIANVACTSTAFKWRNSKIEIAPFKFRMTFIFSYLKANSYTVKVR